MNKDTLIIIVTYNSGDFIEDCIPQFTKRMMQYLNKAYSFVYDDGPEITTKDLPAFSLDTGRPIYDQYDVNLKPTLWWE